MRPAAAVALAITIVAPRVLHAQARPSLVAHPATAEITLDGRLDEPAWTQAPVSPELRQYEPREGASASQRSEVRVLYGATSLYVGALLHDAEAAKVEPRLGRRDEFNRADWFAVSLDSYLERRTAYIFAVNAAGVQLDGTIGAGASSGGGDDVDESWDAIWFSSVRVTDEGWVVEIAIPYSMLRFPRADEHTWGIQISRYVPRLSELSEWPLVPRAQRSNQVAGFADLTGIRGIEPRRNVQVQPYSVARLARREDPERPGTADGDREIDVGADLKFGLGPNVTLDATVNPDFGQVEADPAVLNLTAFETIFEERRPFFVEGSQIYRFRAGPGQLLYTRRIGAGEPIIGATKLSGRTARGLSFGLLGASTGDDFRPERNYGVARATQQLGRYSSAGGIVTLYDARAEPGRARSLVAGADADLRFLDNRYGLETFAAVTNRSWTDGALPGERGFAGKVWGRKRQGVWQGFAGLDVFSDDFNPNDVGQMPFDNTYAMLSEIEHQINGNRPFGPFQRASATLFGLQRFAYSDRLNQGLELELRSEWLLRGFQTIEAAVSVERPLGGYDLFETRGAGPWAAPAVLELGFEFGTDERRSWRLEPEVGFGFQKGGGRGYAAELRGEWSASDRLSLEGSVAGETEKRVVSWSSNETFLATSGGWSIARVAGRAAGDDPADYVAFDDGGTLARILTGVQPIGPGRYYVPVFGARDTRSTDVTVRGTYTFTPNLSFQLYSQLFLAKGRRRDIRILRTPDETAPFPAFPKRNEFAFSRMQSNAVLRWQYRPGSTMYVVWTHGRNAEDELEPLATLASSPYALSVRRQIGQTFDAFPDDILLIKISYTFLN